ncbi:hypothetical protein [Streptomyces sp. NPDC087317]|uniref:hypothetical protein n=1 Tax=Streptomyces sp. NPDC087317 TaxID=3365784 RepID=UPI0038274276
MSRGGGPRRRRTRHVPSGGLVPWTLSLPARLHVRWLVILLVTVAVMGAYGRVLVTARPMPPSQAPAAGLDDSEPVPAPSATVGPTPEVR